MDSTQYELDFSTIRMLMDQAHYELGPWQPCTRNETLLGRGELHGTSGRAAVLSGVYFIMSTNT